MLAMGLDTRAALVAGLVAGLVALAVIVRGANAIVMDRARGATARFPSPGRGAGQPDRRNT